jgi:hypothetical protein
MFTSRLAARISDLEDEGWKFETEKVGGDYVYRVVERPKASRNPSFVRFLQFSQGKRRSTRTSHARAACRILSGLRPLPCMKRRKLPAVQWIPCRRCGRDTPRRAVRKAKAPLCETCRTAPYKRANFTTKETDRSTCALTYRDRRRRSLAAGGP